MTTSDAHALIGATYLGPANATALTGLPWRRVRDIAIQLGVRRVRCGRAQLVPLDEFRRALERARAVEDAGSEADPAATVRASLGVRRRGERTDG